jgi:transcription initiation factor IIE alpha subunit
MTLQDWYACPNCHMPCSSQPFLAILAAEGKCPTCSAAVSMQDVREVQEPLTSAAGF